MKFYDPASNLAASNYREEAHRREPRCEGPAFISKRFSIGVKMQSAQHHQTRPFGRLLLINRYRRALSIPSDPDLFGTI